MTAIRALFAFELRRGLSIFGTGFLLLLVLPVVRLLRGAEGNYWDGWNVWGASLAVFVLAPLLVLAMSSSGWASERSLLTLDWLYSRPIGAASIFFVRLTSILVLAAVWILAAASLNDLDYEALSNLQELAPSIGSPIVFASLVLILALGAGLFASAVSESSAAAGRVALFLLLVVGTVAGAMPRLVPHAERLHMAYGLTLPASIDFTTTVLGGAAVSLLLGAWAASIRAPEDRRRVRRGLAILVPFSVVTVAYALSILYAPLGVSGPARHELPLGGNSTIGLAPAAGGDFLAHPVIVRGESRKVISQLWGGQHLFASSQLGVAVMDQYTSQNDRRWLALDRQGAITYLDVEDTYHRAPLGWSPNGRRFAWTYWGDSNPDSETPQARQRWRRNRNVIVLEKDLSLRTLELPATEPHGPWVASWIDDETLLITVQSSRFVARDSWWLTLSVHGEVSGPWPLEAGASLAAPALGEIHWFGNTALPLLEGVPAVVLESTDPGAPSRIVALDRDTGVVREGPVAELQIGSFGADGVGGVVWLSIVPQSADEVGESVWQLSALGSQPRRACTLPSGGRGPNGTPAIRYFGTAGRWVLFKPGGLVRDIYACDPRSGDTRTIEIGDVFGVRQTVTGERGIWTADGWRTID